MEPKEEMNVWLITTRRFNRVCILIEGKFHPNVEKSQICVHLGLAADIIVSDMSISMKYPFMFYV